MAAAAAADEEVPDIPELGEDFWSRARPGLFYRPIKQQVTLRIDADIVAWFKARAGEGGGYQTRINRALREHMQRAVRKGQPEG